MSRAAEILVSTGTAQLLDTDYNTIIYNATGGNITAKLPAFSNVGSGVYFKLKRIDTTSNTVSVSSVNPSTETIDGNASINFYPNDRYGLILYNGLWYTVDSPPYQIGNTGPTGSTGIAGPTGPSGPNAIASTTGLGSVSVSTGLSVTSSGALSVVYGPTGAIQTSRIANSFSSVYWSLTGPHTGPTGYNKLVYNSVLSDVNGNFSVASGLYTAPSSGTYEVTVTFDPGNGSAYPTTSGNYAAGVYFGFGPMLSTSSTGNNTYMVWNDTTGNGNGTTNVQYFTLSAGNKLQSQYIVNGYLPTTSYVYYSYASFTAVLIY
jgi:hypothetical protein